MKSSYAKSKFELHTINSNGFEEDASPDHQFYAKESSGKINFQSYQSISINQSVELNE